MLEQAFSRKYAEGRLATQSGSVVYWTSRVEDPQADWLVFLPGLTADHTLFYPQLDYYADRAHCLVWDAPAHGASRPFDLNFTMFGYADYLHQILELEGAGFVVLVGQSLGGYISQCFIERYPEQVRGFVSIDSAPLQRSYYSSWELALLHHTYTMYMMFPWGFLKDYASKNIAMSPDGQANMRAIMDSYEKKEYCRLTAHGYNMLAEAVEQELPYEIPCPVLLFCGEEDRAGSCKRYSKAWAARTGYPLHWLPNAGHNSTWDAPDLIHEAVDRFLGELV